MFEVYSILRRIGPEVRTMAERGHKLSIDLMTWYNLHYKCPADPGAQAVVSDLTIAWCEKFPGINKRTYQAVLDRERART